MVANALKLAACKRLVDCVPGGLGKRRSTSPEPDAWAFAVAYLLLLPVYLAPLFVTALLPGLDLPFHISIVDMLAKRGQAGSPYAPFYEATMRPAPYAAYYLVMLGLGKIMPLLIAHKLVIAGYVAALPLGASALLGACGRSRVPALLAFPLAYNMSLHYGFLSFTLSLPVMLFLLAELSRFLLARESEPWRWLLTTALAALLFFCHLQNFLYGLCASLAFIVLSGARWPRLLQGLAAFAPALGAAVYWQVTVRFSADPLQHRKTFAFAWNTIKWARLGDRGKRGLAEDLKSRIADLPEHVLRGFADSIDVRASQCLLLIIGVYALGGLLGWRAASASAAARPRMRVAGAVAFAGALFAYLVLPHHLPALDLTTCFPRFAILVVLTALLLLPAGLKRLSGVARCLLLLPAFAFSVIYGGVLVERYRKYGRENADFMAVVERVPPGGRALGLAFDRASKVMRIESALLGLTNFYPAARPALGSMTPLSYCGMRHIPCHEKLGSGALFPAPNVWTPQRLDPEAAVRFFDYFFIRSPPPGYDVFRTAKPKVELLARQGAWWVFRRKPKPGS